MAAERDQWSALPVDLAQALNPAASIHRDHNDGVAIDEHLDTGLLYVLQAMKEDAGLQSAAEAGKTLLPMILPSLPSSLSRQA